MAADPAKPKLKLKAFSEAFTETEALSSLLSKALSKRHSQTATQAAHSAPSAFLYSQIIPTQGTHHLAQVTDLQTQLTPD